MVMFPLNTTAIAFDFCGGFPETRGEVVFVGVRLEALGRPQLEAVPKVEVCLPAVTEPHLFLAIIWSMKLSQLK